MNRTPMQSGFFMPAEWALHDGIFLSWPHDKITFPDLPMVEKTYVQIIAGLQESEHVNLFVVDDGMQERIVSLLKAAKIDLENITFWQHDYVDVWFRDYGPTFIINPKRKVRDMVKWTFNAWGEKYPSLMKDDDVPPVIQKELGMRMRQAGLVMEGGSLEVNGKGTLLTTEECLLNKNRNPKMSKAQIETKLKDHLGLTNIIWLKKGIQGDDTDAHIDNLARFTDEKTIVCLYEDDKRDANSKNLEENYQILLKAKDQDGKPFKVIKIQQPKLKGYGRRLPVSYMNFYIANKAVLMPVFGHKNDAAAVKAIGELFPGRKMVPIDCSKLIFGGGTLHCISQQMPSI